MRKKLFLVAFAAALTLGGLFGYHQATERAAGTLVSAADPSTAAMKPAPIPPTWILSGRPETKAASLGKTSDGTAEVFVWQTTAATFRWNYASDEIIHIIDGETFVTDSSGVERRLGPGDVAIFPTGAKTTWRVPDHVRKIAIMKRKLPALVEAPLRWMRQVKAWLEPSSGSAFAAN